MISIGQSLREEREARNISLEEVASATKIVPRYLEALEADRLDRMPGGFFIKGIIRSYAAAIGLNPDEVLARYRGAGLIDGQEHSPQPPPKTPAGPAPRLRMPSAGHPGAPPIALEAGKGSAPPLVIEEAPRPRLSPAARKRIFAWAWRILAVAAIAAGLFALWSSRRPETPPSKPETVTSQTAAPPRQTAEPAPKSAAPAGPEAGQGLVPAPPVSEPLAGNVSEPATEPAPRPAPAAAGDAWRGVTIEITFQAETWIQVRTDGELKINGIFPAGATARAQADERILIHTGNAGGFAFRLNGQMAKPLGRLGQVITDIKITPENLRDFLEVPLSGPPTG